MKFSRYTKGRSGTLALRAVQAVELSLGSILGLCIFESIAAGQFGGTTNVTKVVPPKEPEVSNAVRISSARFVASDGSQSYI
jgi:hypothetical protein